MDGGFSRRRQGRGTRLLARDLEYHVCPRFSLTSCVQVANLTLRLRTNEEFADYLAQTWFPGASPDDFQKLLKLYPSDPAAGSPFGTGDANAFTPEYKRISAVQGDWYFNAPRRQLLDRLSWKHKWYNFCKLCSQVSYCVYCR